MLQREYLYLDVMRITTTRLHDCTNVRYSDCTNARPARAGFMQSCHRSVMQSCSPLIMKSLIFLLLPMGSSILTSAETKNIEVPVSTITDKIRGGLLGQILGNLNGLEHEFKYEKTPGNVISYTPALPKGAVTDDDTDFEWVYICEMQKKRNPFLSYEEINKLWLERINKRIWCSNRYARHLMDIGIQAPLTGNILLNPWADFNVSGQFLCETFGLLSPAMPQTAAKIGLQYTKVAIDNEPAQTTQLFTAMIATAFVENDINKILDAGAASIDPASEVAANCRHNSYLIPTN